MTISLLVFWIWYIIHSHLRINELAARFGGESGLYHWVVLAIGCVLFVTLIVGLSWQMAQNISQIRYQQKQQEFVANITHELKSPLAAIKLHGQTLTQQNVTAEEKQKFLGYILTQVERMEVLVEKVLQVGRLQDRAEILQLESVLVADFVADYQKTLPVKLEPKNLALRTDQKTDASVLVDRFALTRILDNLFDNAVKASSQNSQVDFIVSEKGRNIIFEVKDRGQGIAKKELRRVFDRFYQIGSEISARRSGTGLGLAIVKALAKEMGGSVSVESDGLKKGASFKVRFPKV